MKGYTDRLCGQCGTFTQHQILTPRRRWRCLNCDGEFEVSSALSDREQQRRNARLAAVALATWPLVALTDYRARGAASLAPPARARVIRAIDAELRRRREEVGRTGGPHS